MTTEVGRRRLHNYIRAPKLIKWHNGSADFPLHKLCFSELDLQRKTCAKQNIHLTTEMDWASTGRHPRMDPPTRRFSPSVTGARTCARVPTSVGLLFSLAEVPLVFVCFCLLAGIFQ